jgi:hypothetical protein
VTEVERAVGAIESGHAAIVADAGAPAPVRPWARTAP